MTDMKCGWIALALELGIENLDMVRGFVGRGWEDGRGLTPLEMLIVLAEEGRRCALVKGQHLPEPESTIAFDDLKHAQFMQARLGPSRLQRHVIDQGGRAMVAFDDHWSYIHGRSLIDEHGLGGLIPESILTNFDWAVLIEPGRRRSLDLSPSTDDTAGAAYRSRQSREG